MKHQFVFLKVLIKKIIILLLLYMVARIIFYMFHFNSFDFPATVDFLKALFCGIRFDISAICASNTLIILLYLIPLRLRENKTYLKLLGILFIVFNSAAFLLNFIDLQYFYYYERRLDFPALSYLIANLRFSDIAFFFSKYLIVLVFWILFTLFLFKVNQRVRIRSTEKIKGIIYYPVQSLIMIIILGLTLLGIRGGFQYKPLDIINAGLCTYSGNFSLVTNNPFVLIKTMDDNIIEFHYDRNPKGQLFLNPVQSFNTQNKFNNKNVVIIVLESFSKEFSGKLNPNYSTDSTFISYTPFLDSLMDHSIVCLNSYANDENSIRSLPNILSGIPSWMQDDLTLSVYSQNKIESIASVLKEKGYYTAFFHGGKNGTMNFDSYVKSVGFDHYYGMDEYPDKKDFDGKWGIFDHAFFSFFAGELSNFQQPFIAGIFSLSSHDPYEVPEQFKSQFNNGRLPIHNVAAYSDFSLERFFKAAKKTDWFQHTIFVITADHGPRARERYMPFYKTNAGKFAVPIIFYIPGFGSMEINELAQQTDIFPTTLGLLNFNGEIFSFGKNLLSESNDYVLNRLGSDTYLFMKDSIVWIYNKDSATQMYNLNSDSLMKNNLINSKIADSVDYTYLFRAVMSTYKRTMTKNIMTPERYKYKTKWTE